MVRARPLARQVLITQVLVVLLMVVSGIVLAAYNARLAARDRATERAVAVAQTIADGPTTRTALKSSDPSSTLQPYAEAVRRDTRVDFVTVMSLDRLRYTHPDPSRIGKEFVGDVGGAAQGRVFTQQYTGTLGPSMRAVVPVSDNGRVVALVSVGITIENIDRELWPTTLLIISVGSAVMAVGLFGTWLITRRLRRQTQGMSAPELRRMYEYHHAVLHAVQEGLLLLDRDHRVQLANNEARELLVLPPEQDLVGRHISELGLPPALSHAVVSGETESDDVYLVGGRALVVSSGPARWEGADVGAVVTVRDRTELQAVSGELDVVRRLTSALRAQNHESANRLHTVVSLIEMDRPEEAIEIATEELQIAQLLADQVVEDVGDPVLAALLLGKSAEAAERGASFEIVGEVSEQRCAISGRDLITVVGNLSDNALDAVSDASPGRVRIDVDWTAERLVLSADDNGPGIRPEDAENVLGRGWSTKAGPPGSRGVGLALVQQVAQRCDGSVSIGRSDLGGAQVKVMLRERT